MKALGITKKRPFKGPQLTISWNPYTGIHYFPLNAAFSVLPVLGKLICYSWEFDYLILVVCVSMNQTNKTRHIRVFRYVAFIVLNCFVNYFELCRKWKGCLVDLYNGILCGNFVTLMAVGILFQYISYCVSFLKLNLCLSNVCAACLPTADLSLTFSITR